MRLVIAKECDGSFVVEPPHAPGSPIVGRGKTMLEAIGSYFHANQTDLGIEFEVEASAVPAEMRRRARELAKR